MAGLDPAIWRAAQRGRSGRSGQNKCSQQAVVRSRPLPATSDPLINFAARGRRAPLARLSRGSTSYLEAPPMDGTAQLLESDRRFLVHPLHHPEDHRTPLLVTEGRGAMLHLADGREVID